MSEEKVDLNDYLTRAEAQEQLGCTTRTFWRIVDRIGKDKVCKIVLGRTLIKKDSLPLLKQYFYAPYSDAHQRMVKAWGASGGKAKAANAAKDSL
jgi:hypothetical protein